MNTFQGLDDQIFEVVRIFRALKFVASQTLWYPSGFWSSQSLLPNISNLPTKISKLRIFVSHSEVYFVNRWFLARLVTPRRKRVRKDRT